MWKHCTQSVDEEVSGNRERVVEQRFNFRERRDWNMILLHAAHTLRERKRDPCLLDCITISRPDWRCVIDHIDTMLSTTAYNFYRMCDCLYCCGQIPCLMTCSCIHAFIVLFQRCLAYLPDHLHNHILFVRARADQECI